MIYLTAMKAVKLQSHLFGLLLAKVSFSYDTADFSLMDFLLNLPSPGGLLLEEFEFSSMRVGVEVLRGPGPIIKLFDRLSLHCSKRLCDFLAVSFGSKDDVGRKWLKLDSPIDI